LLACSTNTEILSNKNRRRYPIERGLTPGAIRVASAAKMPDIVMQALSAAVGDGIKDGVP